jgi:hypothetical protein
MLGKMDRDFFPRELAASFVDEDRRVMRTGKTRTYYSQMVPDISGPLELVCRLRLTAAGRAWTHLRRRPRALRHA